LRSNYTRTNNQRRTGLRPGALCGGGRFCCSRGFTLIELMIVIFIMLILVSIAIPNFNGSVQRARESVLRQNLFQPHRRSMI